MLQLVRHHWQRAKRLRQADLERSALFFFYGSLMERYGNFNRFIKKHVRQIEPAFCRGSLYFLPAGFPGLIIGDQHDHQLVAGELMQFDQPLRVMRLLDKLEEFYPLQPRRSIYLRRRLPVLVERIASDGDGQPVLQRHDAWVYIYPRRLLRQDRGALSLPCGQWRSFRDTPQLPVRTGCHSLRLCDSQQQILVDELFYQQPQVQQACRQLCDSHRLCQQARQLIPQPNAGFPATDVVPEPHASG